MINWVIYLTFLNIQFLSYIHMYRWMHAYIYMIHPVTDWKVGIISILSYYWAKNTWLGTITSIKQCLMHLTLNLTHAHSHKSKMTFDLSGFFEKLISKIIIIVQIMFVDFLPVKPSPMCLNSVHVNWIIRMKEKRILKEGILPLTAWNQTKLNTLFNEQSWNTVQLVIVEVTVVKWCHLTLCWSGTYCQTYNQNWNILNKEHWDI